MKNGTRSPGLRAVPSPGRASASAERLTFNLGRGTVPGRGLAEAAIAREREPSFATAPHAQPRDWGYFGLLAFTAVLLLRPQDTIRALEPLHLAEVFAIIGIGPMLLHRFAKRQPVFRVTPETIGLLVFGAAILVSVPLSIWPTGSLAVFTDHYLKFLVVFVLMMNTLTTPKRLEQITWLILLCCGVIAARAVADYARGINLVEGNRLAGPVSGLFGNPNDLAMNMVTFLPVAVMVAISGRASPVRRVTALGIAGLMLATIAFTKSRSGFVGFAVMFIALIVLGGRVRRGFGTAAVVALLAVAPFMPATFWQRMASITDDRKDKEEFTGTRETRRDLMIGGLKAFRDYPLTGIGAGQYVNYNPPGRKVPWRDTHNALIQVAAETGIIGLLAFSFLLVRAWRGASLTRRLLRRKDRSPPSDPVRYSFDEHERGTLYTHTVMMTAGLAGWFVCSLFASVALYWTFYYVLALIISARELTLDRFAAVRTAQANSTKTFSLGPRGRRARWQPGVA